MPLRVNRFSRKLAEIGRRFAGVLCALGIFAGIRMPAAFGQTQPATPEEMDAKGAQPEDADDALTPSGEEEIVVRGKPPRTAFVKRIDLRTIREKGAVHVGQALEGEAGVELQESPKQGVLLQLGGFDVKASSVFVEGIPFVEPYSGLADLSQLPAGLFCAFTVHRGIVPVTLGPDTIGGRVDLDILGCPAPRMAAFVQAGNWHDGVLTWRAGVSGRVRRGAWTFFGAADGLVSNGHPLSAGFRTTPENAGFPDDGGLRDASSRRLLSAAAGFSWRPPGPFSLTALAIFLRAPREIPPHIQSGYERHWTLSDNDSLLLGTRAAWFFPGGRLRRVWGMLAAHLHRDRVDDWEDLSHTHPTTNPAAFFVSSEYQNLLLGAEAGSLFSLGGDELEIAALWRLARHFSREKPVSADGFDAAWGKYDEMWLHRVTLAAENRFPAGSWTLFQGLSGGMLQLMARRLREEAYAVDETPMPGVEGRAGARRDFGRNLSLEAATGYKIRYPALKELFSNRVGGNPELDPERALMAQAALQARRGRARLELRLQAARVDGLIDRWGETYQNLDDALIAGVEAEWQWEWRGLQVRARYRGQSARILSSGREIPGRARHRGFAGIAYRWRRAWLAGIDADARSAVTLQYYGVEDGLFHEGTSGARVLLNARLRHDRDFSGNFSGYVQLSGRNLLDAPTEEGTFEPRPGREIWMEFGLQY